MHPYRDPPPTVRENRAAWNTEEVVLYALLVVIGTIPVASAIVEHARFGVEATVGLIMLCAGAIGLGRQIRGRRKV